MVATSADAEHAVNDRRCIVTRESRPAGELIRFVAAPDGRVVADLRGRLPGRGAWVTARHGLVERAVRQRAFSRALKATVTADDGLADEVRRLLLARALSALGLAARAGQVITGFAKVERASRRGSLALVFTANDAAADGRAKIARAVAAAAAAPPHRDAIFSGEQLSLALGRSNVVHAGVAAGRAAASLQAALARYEIYTEDGVANIRAA
jgi:hypothetical protein